MNWVLSIFAFILYSSLGLGTREWLKQEIIDGHPVSEETSLKYYEYEEMKKEDGKQNVCEDFIALSEVVEAQGFGKIKITSQVTRDDETQLGFTLKLDYKTTINLPVAIECTITYIDERTRKPYKFYLILNKVGSHWRRIRANSHGINNGKRLLVLPEFEYGEQLTELYNTYSNDVTERLSRLQNNPERGEKMCQRVDEHVTPSESRSVLSFVGVKFEENMRLGLDETTTITIPGVLMCKGRDEIRYFIYYNLNREEPRLIEIFGSAETGKFALEINFLHKLKDE